MGIRAGGKSRAIRRSEARGRKRQQEIRSHFGTLAGGVCECCSEKYFSSIKDHLIVKHSCKDCSYRPDVASAPEICPYPKVAKEIIAK